VFRLAVDRIGLTCGWISQSAYRDIVLPYLPCPQNTYMPKIPIFKCVKTASMKLGAFSLSLNVSDLEASKAFYETLGFSIFGGAMDKKYLIMKNGRTLIGLFEGMFENNILTFNPGWDQTAQPLRDFMDVREIHAAVVARGHPTEQEAGLDGNGPASFVVIDPDGNPVLVDQHVPKP